MDMANSLGLIERATRSYEKLSDEERKSFAILGLSVYMDFTDRMFPHFLRCFGKYGDTL